MRTRRWILSSLSLAGLFGCDVEATAPAAVPRKFGEPLPPLYDCLLDTHVVLKHADGTVDEDDVLSEGLAKYARPGDTVEVTLARLSGCEAEGSPRVSLAAYTVEGSLAEKEGGSPALAYDMDTALISEEPRKLVVRLPDCVFRLELVHGEAPRTLAPSGLAPAADDRIVAVQGGDVACKDIPTLALSAFDTVERGWGDAPLLTHFGWSAQIDAGKPLACAFDLDGDGELERLVYPCEPSTAGLGVATLPAHTYLDPGEHRPMMMVSDGVRRLWASTTVHANNLQLKANVRYPEKALGFAKAEVIEGKEGELSQVTLHFDGYKPPLYKPGTIILSRGPTPFLLRVVEFSLESTSATYFGYPARLDQVVAGGYYGVRDVQIPTEGANCVGECIGELEPVDGAPGQGVAPAPLAKGALVKGELAEGGEEHKYGFKITVPLNKFGGGAEGGAEEETASEAELFGGIVVKKFVIDNLVFGDLRVDVHVVPTIEAAVALVQTFSASMSLGEWKIAALPIPIPITLDMLPELGIESSFKFAGKFTAEAPIQLVHDADGWKNNVDGTLKADAEAMGAKPGAELALESKVTFIDKFEFSLGFLKGPHVAPYASLGLKATADPAECKFCVTVFGELGALMGWSSSWGFGSLVDPVDVSFSEIEFKKHCDPIVGFCEPEPPEPPGGGTHGDVHVITHDGLLFDFQAGGEFVLVRATEGTPLEIQARQEPIGDALSLSYNTAVATTVGGARVGIYTELPSAIYVDGVPKTLDTNSQITVGVGGVLARDGGDLYTLTYPGGELLRVRHKGSHLDLAVALPAERAGAVEGVLGNGNGDVADDVGVAGGFIPQPVDFDLLYRGANSFAEAWRVAPGGSLFDYAAGTSAQTFREAPYASMPIGLPPPNPPHLDTAQAACAACPPALRDGCLLDVGFTDDPSFADACDEVTVDVEEVMIPADGLVCVSPRYFDEIDLADQKLVFRGPGLADADQYPAGLDLEVHVNGRFGLEQGFFGISTFDTAVAPAGGGSDWGTKFECAPIGDGSWGECTLRIDLLQGPHSGVHFPIYEWSVRTSDDLLIDRAYFVRP